MGGRKKEKIGGKYKGRRRREKRNKKGRWVEGRNKRGGWLEGRIKKVGGRKDKRRGGKEGKKHKEDE